MYKTPLNIGTLAGIAGFALFLLLYYIGLSPLGVGKFLGFWIPIVAVVWANIRVREQILGGSMTYMQAFTSGVLTVLTWCTFKGFCIFIFTSAFDQHVITQYLEFTKGYLSLLEGTGNDDLLKQIDMKELEAATTPWNLMIGDIANNILYGSVITLVLAFITKRDPQKPKA